MKKTNHKIVFLILLIIGIVSCNSDDFQSKNNEILITSKSDSRIDEGPSNALNSWDESGAIHNEVLQKVVDNQHKLNNDFNSYVTYASEVYIADYGNPNQETLGTERVRTILADSLNFYKNRVLETTYSESVKTRLFDLINIFETVVKGDEIGYSEFKAEIVNLENDIINDRISLEEKEILLKTTSVARYSCYFWINELQLSNNRSERRRKWWKWAIVGLADVAGGFVGGSLMGPAGAVVGAVETSSGALDIIEPCDCN